MSDICSLSFPKLTDAPLAGPSVHCSLFVTVVRTLSRQSLPTGACCYYLAQAPVQILGTKRRRSYVQIPGNRDESQPSLHNKAYIIIILLTRINPSAYRARVIARERRGLIPVQIICLKGLRLATTRPPLLLISVNLSSIASWQTKQISIMM